ncbi:hypothetical protein SprV_0501783800 [Sparganum proliferum]
MTHRNRRLMVFEILSPLKGPTEASCSSSGSSYELESCRQQLAECKRKLREKDDILAKALFSNIRRRESLFRLVDQHSPQLALASDLSTGDCTFPVEFKASLRARGRCDPLPSFIAAAAAVGDEEATTVTDELSDRDCPASPCADASLQDSHLATDAADASSSPTSPSSPVASCCTPSKISAGPRAKRRSHYGIHSHARVYRDRLTVSDRSHELLIEIVKCVFDSEGFFRQAQSTVPGQSSVHNLSSKQLTEDQVKVLQHESSYNTGDAQPVDFIAALEATLSKTDTTEDSKDAIRQGVASLIISYRPRRTIPSAEVKAIKELKRDEEIVIVPADKGRATVVLDKSEYVAKAQQLLNDNQSYKVIDSDPIKALVGKINKSLNQMRNEKAISEKDWRQMKPQDTALARFYGLPKIHKPNVPLRPIVALKGTPTYGLAKWLAKHLKKLTDGSEHTAVSSTHFLERLKGVIIAPDEIMVSFDVVSLFTSIPKELAMRVVDDLLKKRYDEEGKPFKRRHAMKLLDYCLRTYFTFNGQIYEQIQGTPMGSPISGYLAEAVSQELETRVFQTYKPKFWMRYVDDTFVFLHRDAKDNFKRELDSVFPQIQFTMEEETNGVLSFLDVQVSRQEDGTLQTGVFQVVLGEE